MKPALIAVSIFALTIGAAWAADGPIETREALMEANGASAAVSGAMLKGDMEYNPAVAKAAIRQLHATAMAYGAFFPEKPKEGEKTSASPKIWDDPDGWQQALGKFKTDTAAAVEAAGKDGPADLDAFKAAVGPVLGNCRSCHEDFRVRK